MAPEEAPLLKNLSDGVATLTLNRARQRNALSMALMADIENALNDLSTDKQVSVIVIRANGTGFCSGHDLKEMRADPREEAHTKTYTQCARMMEAIVASPKPVIAAVHCIATAAGCQLVASCDLAIASRDARFATPGVNIGLFCSTPMVALTRNVGRKQAMEMLLTGDFIDAEYAASIGLINRVVEKDDLDNAVDTLAR
jgi:enoyl-CoA hydratase/carnithine racemase